MKQVFRIFILTVVLVAGLSGGAARAAQPHDFRLVVRHHLLSATLEQAALGEALEALARQMHLAVFVDSSVAQDPITVAFEEVSLEEAIRRLLGAHRYALTFAPTPARKQLQVVAITVFRTGGATPAPTSTSEETVPDPLPAAIEQDPAPCHSPTSAKGQPQPATEPDDDALAGLQDDDAHRRDASLEQLSENDTPLPLEPITDMALTDRDPQLRMHALELLDERGGENAIGPLLQAAQDPDPDVRLLAKDLLTEHKVSAETLLESLRGTPL